MSTKSVRLTLALTAFALTVGTIPSFAATIPLGTTTTAGYTGTLLASISGSGTAPSGPGVIHPFSASYTESVYRGGTGALCPTCLSFVLTFSNTGTAGADPIERTTMSNFTGYTVAADYVAGAGVAPTDATLTSGIIGFDFGNAIAAGSSSDTLVVYTNAINYTPGFLSFQDGSTLNEAGFMPASPTPEPSSLILLGTGLVGLAGAARRRFKI